MFLAILVVLRLGRERRGLWAAGLRGGETEPQLVRVDLMGFLLCSLFFVY